MNNRTLIVLIFLFFTVNTYAKSKQKNKTLEPYEFSKRYIIVVLPFEDKTKEKKYEAIGAGIADQIEQAVSQVLSDGVRTKDIQSEGTTCIGTDEMGDAVVKALSSLVN